MIEQSSPTISYVEGAPAGSCPVGKWVTVTRTDGWVPSTSVVWQQASSLVESALATVFSPHQAQAAALYTTRR